MYTLPRSSSLLRFAALNGARGYVSSVNLNEVQHFSKLSAVWWDEKGPIKGLHAFNPVRIPFIRDGLVKANKVKEEDLSQPGYLKGITILDIGCGGGILSIPLARLGGNVVGLDPSVELIEVAKNHANNTLESNCSINFVNSLLEEHARTNKEKYDVVIASEVIEHVPSKQEFIKACTQCLKPGGSFFITAPSRTLKGWLLWKLIMEYITRNLKIGQHDWSDFITFNHLAKLLEHYDFKVIQGVGLIYNPYKNVWRCIKDDSYAYAMHAIKQA